MRLNKRWCDLILKVDGKEFHAYKNILAANLRYFETMLLGDSFRESKEGVVTMDCMNATKETSQCLTLKFQKLHYCGVKVVLNKTSSLELEAFITYAYTGEISLTDDNALSLLETANYLGEDGIKQACIAILEKYLKVEESFRAYDFAKSIECLSLKNTAKSTILLNFESSSQTSQYLDLDFENLSDFLSDGKVQLVRSQQTLFEGIVRWITHDANKRRTHINDLLSLIDVTKLPADYLMKYLGSIANPEDDDSAIVIKDLIFWHYTRSKSQLIAKNQVEHPKQTLMIIGEVDRRASFNSTISRKAKKWSQPEEFKDAKINIHSCAVLNDEFYFISGNPGSYSLKMFNPSTKLITIVSSSSNISSTPAICACSRFVYLCGGQIIDGSRSDQVLRYDPRTNSFETLPPMGSRRDCAATIFYRDRLHVLGGANPFVVNKVEKYDPDAKKWMELPSMRQPHLQHAVAVLDGKLYVCGGFASYSVEVYDPAKNSWQLVASTNKERKMFTLVAYEGKLLAIGGAEEPSVEVYDPSKNTWQMDDEMSSGLQIKRNIGGLISSNCVTDAQ